MRLLLIVNVFASIGGAETQLFHLARGLAGNGHEVTVCCISSSHIAERELAGSGLEVVELGADGRNRRPLAVPRMARLARRAEVVHCTMWDPSLWGRIAAIAARRPVIVADHATDRSAQVTASGRQRGNWIARHNRLLDRFTYATVACAASQRSLLIGEGVDPLKIVHIPNGIPVDSLRAAAGGGSSRTELGLPASGPIAMQVGLFRAEKNQLGALEAFAGVRASVPDVQLVFIGDGPTMETVEARAEELGARSWAHFLGRRDDVAALLGHAELLLQPSTADAMPMTVLEAMAVGVPVLASDVGDIGAMAGTAAICVAPGDLEALREQATRLLREPATREQMSRDGVERARSYDSAAMVRRYEALFRAARAGAAPAIDAN